MCPVTIFTLFFLVLTCKDTIIIIIVVADDDNDDAFDYVVLLH